MRKYILILLAFMFITLPIKYSAAEVIDGLYSGFTYLDNQTIPSSNKNNLFLSGSASRRFSFSIVPNRIESDSWFDYRFYVSGKYCVDSNATSFWEYSGGNADRVSIINTNQTCVFPNSKGKVLYIFWRTTWEDGPDVAAGYFDLYFHNYISIYKMDLRVSLQEFQFDSATNTLIDQQQETNDKLDGLNDSLTSESLPDTDIDNDFSYGPISNLLLVVPNTFTKILNATTDSCTPYNLGSLYGTNLVMPCIDIENYVGSAIWSIIDIIISGSLAIVLSKQFIKIYDNITSLERGDPLDG